MPEIPDFKPIGNTMSLFSPQTALVYLFFACDQSLFVVSAVKMVSYVCKNTCFLVTIGYNVCFMQKIQNRDLEDFAESPQLKYMKARSQKII